MAKSVLIEKNGGAPLKFNEKASGRNPKALGHLEGIAAQYNKPTRNGRRYPRELWENIIKSDDYKEMMETMTCFCENDHPADNTDRIETSIKEISAVLTNLEISDDGNVYAGFDILDTPQGHILKSLAEYGCSIGVSSRGLGDEIQKDGEVIIDPSTYQFYAFDMVVMPAVKSARPAVTESKKRSNKAKVSLADTFAKEVETATSVAELKSLKRVVSNLPGLDSIKESIDIKLKSMKDGDNILSILENDLGRISEDNIRLADEVDTLKSKLSANNIRYQRLHRAYNESRQAVKSLRKSLQSNMVNCAQLQTEVYNGAMETEYAVKSSKYYESKLANDSARKDREYRALKGELARTKKALDESQRDLTDVKRKLVETRKENSASLETVINDSQNRLNESRRNGERKANAIREDLCKANSDVDKLTEERNRIAENLEQSQSAVRKLAEERKILKSENESLVKSLNESESVIKDLVEANGALKEKCSQLSERVQSITSKQVLEEKKTQKQISSYKKALAEQGQMNTEALNKYLETKCAQNGLKLDTVRELLPRGYTITDIDRVVGEMADRKRRYDALPFAIPGNITKIVENRSNLSDEDKQTMTFLESACKNL